MALPASQSASWGAVVIVDDPQERNGIPFIHVHQAPLQTALMHPSLVKDSNLRSQAAIGFGPVSIDFHVDVANETFSITASVLGIGLGTFSASLDKGLVLNVNLLVAKGTLTFYTQDGGLYMRADLKLTFGNSYTTTVKIVQYK